LNLDKQNLKSTVNKKKGSNFENDFCNILAQYGFWARKDKGYAQTCDIIAGKNNKIYLFECKTCSKDYFNTKRVEDNQNYSRERFRECGNSNCYFVYKLDNGEIYISQDAIKKPSTGQKLEEFLNDNK